MRSMREMQDVTGSVIAYDRLEADLAGLATEYRSAEPFPHVVLDDVLVRETFDRAVAEFPEPGDEFWKGYLHVNETKYSNTSPDTWGPTLQAVARDFYSPRFVAFLEKLTGIDGLITDWSMDGGGLHQTLTGGHLNVHADFSTHHDHPDWARRINILLYLNTEWHEEWGGELELWDRDMTACQQQVRPAGNRMLVFTTAHDTYHGHPDGLRCPAGVARKSLALYYFTHDELAVRRATNYQARPHESRLRRLAISADRAALDVYDRLKRRLGITDERANRVLARLHRVRRRRRRLGSGTQPLAELR